MTNEQLIQFQSVSGNFDSNAALANVQYPNDIVKATGRPGLAFTITENFEMLRAETICRGTSPMQIFESFSGINLNFARNMNGKKGGASGHISWEEIPHVLRKAGNAVDLCDKTKKSSGNTIEGPLTESLKTPIAFVTSAMRSQGDNGKTALELASKYPVSECITCMNNLSKAAQNGGKYADNNRKQASAMYLAVSVVNAKKLSVGGRTIAEHILAGGDMNSLSSAFPQNTQEASIVAGIQRYLSSPMKDEFISIIKDGGETAGEESYEIYSALKTPNNKKIDETGHCDIYSLDILAHPGKKLPVTVSLRKMKGFPIAGAKVGANIDKNIPADVYAIDLTAEQFYDSMQAAYDTMNAHRIEWTPQMHIMSRWISASHRAQRQQTQQYKTAVNY